MALKSINPYNGEIIREHREWEPEEVQQAIERSDGVFRTWKKSSFETRKEMLLNASGILEKKKDEYAGLITAEMGKPIGEAEAEVLKCAWVCRYYAENGEKFLEKEVIGTDASKSYIVYEPLGTILAVMPWNFPFWQVFRFLAPTLMAGNTSLLKHASNVQGCASAIENLMLESGLPPSVFQNIPVSGSQVASIIDNPAVKAVSLTGSEAAGIDVAVKASQNIKKSLLELGGSNAFIVLDDADLDMAVETGVKARMMNTGQSCIAAKRFIVSKNVFEEFRKRIVTEVKALVVGDPADPVTDIGPLSSEKQAIEVEKQLKRSVEMGAGLITGGDRTGCFIAPAVLTGARPGMPVMDEEVFGPVLSICVVSDEKEAVIMANDTTFGLGATIFTEDIEKGESLAKEIEDGAVFINELVKSDPRLPFGGTKRSGYGRELSKQGIREFVNVKTIFIK